MRIAVDYQPVALKRRTGIGMDAANLLSAMAKEAPELQWLLYQPVSKADFNALERMLWESVSIPLKALKDKPDLIFSPGFSPAIISPAPRVVRVHDLIGLRFPGNQKGFSKVYWSRWMPNAIKKARRIAANSEFTKREIMAFLGIPENRITVVRNSVSSDFRPTERLTRESVRKKFGLEHPYFISVGTLEPRKNIIRLLRAYEQLRRNKKPVFGILVVGKPGGAEKELHSFVAEKKLEHWVKFLGYAEQEDMVALYNASVGYAAVSLHEGFGMPALEAMSCGLSGVCSNATSLPEVVGETAILTDPENEGMIADAMWQYFSDENLRLRLSTLALERSKTFSAQVSAKQMIGVFKDALH